jgi:hypothetical protein
MTQGMDKLDVLNRTLGDVENELLRRRVDQMSASMDQAVDVINQLAADGHVDICPCDDDEE